MRNLFLLIFFSLIALVIVSSTSAEVITTSNVVTPLENKQIKEFSTRKEGNKKITRIVYANDPNVGNVVEEIEEKQDTKEKIQENKEKVKQFISSKFGKKGSKVVINQQEILQQPLGISIKETAKDIVPVQVQKKYLITKTKLNNLKNKLPSGAELKNKLHNALYKDYSIADVKNAASRKLEILKNKINLKQNVLVAKNNLKLKGSIAKEYLKYKLPAKLKDAKNKILYTDINIGKGINNIKQKIPNSLKNLKENIKYNAKKLLYADIKLKKKYWNILKQKVPNKLKVVGSKIKTGAKKLYYSDISIKDNLNKIPNKIKVIPSNIKNYAKKLYYTDINVGDSLKKLKQNVPLKVQNYYKNVIPAKIAIGKQKLYNTNVNIKRTITNIKTKLPTIPLGAKLYAKQEVLKTKNKLSNSGLGKSWRKLKETTPLDVKNYISYKKESLKLKGKELLNKDINIGKSLKGLKEKLPSLSPSVKALKYDLEQKAQNAKLKVLSKKINISNSIKKLQYRIPAVPQDVKDYFKNYIPQKLAEEKLKLKSKTININNAVKRLKQKFPAVPEDLNHYYKTVLPLEIQRAKNKILSSKINFNDYILNLKKKLPSLPIGFKQYFKYTLPQAIEAKKLKLLNKDIKVNYYLDKIKQKPVIQKILQKKQNINTEIKDLVNIHNAGLAVPSVQTEVVKYNNVVETKPVIDYGSGVGNVRTYTKTTKTSKHKSTGLPPVVVNDVQELGISDKLDDLHKALGYHDDYEALRQIHEAKVASLKKDLKERMNDYGLQQVASPDRQFYQSYTKHEFKKSPSGYYQGPNRPHRYCG